MRNFDEMSRMFEEMDRMFENAWTNGNFGDRTTTPMLDGRTTGGIERAGGIGNTTNLHQEDDGFVFVMDLPGFERDEIDLVFRDGLLTVSAVTEVSEESEDSYVRSSRSASETITVPGEIDVEAIEASYHNGVLEVTLPTLEGTVDDGHSIDVR